MSVKDGTKCIKYLLFNFNFVFWLAGTAVLAIGLWLRFDSQTKDIFEAESSTTFYKGIYILIGGGALIMLMGFLGCCGAVRESPYMLGLFFLFLLVIFALEVAAAVWGFSNKEMIIKDGQKFYDELYEKRNHPGTKETLIAVQHALHCCGHEGSIKPVPTWFQKTCPKPKNILDTPLSSCPEAIREVFTSKLIVVIAVGIAVGVVTIFGMVFSMILCCAICRNRKMV